MALRWKRNPRPTGLAGVCAGPQGSQLRDGDHSYATTNYSGRFGSREPKGWFWVARNDSAGVAWKNTCENVMETEEEAKAEAMAYVRACIKAQEGTK